ncbi:DNA polymerase-like protein [Tanacetum coccineum]
MLVRAYCTYEMVKTRSTLSLEKRSKMVEEILDKGLCKFKPIRTKEIRHTNKVYTHITTSKESCKGTKAFIVADLETILVKNTHTPYAAGLMVVRPGKDITHEHIDTYFSEDYSILSDKFEDRSTRVLYEMIHRIEALGIREKRPFTVYFHNFSRFDGILLVRYLTSRVDDKLTLKPLIRNKIFYELIICRGKKIIMRFRDSLMILKGTLHDLVANICPSLGNKKDIDHTSLNKDNLKQNKEEIIEYLRQDVLLLGGIMQKTQAIFFEEFETDIESKLTLASLALAIFRKKFYDDNQWRIYIPSQNADKFIRKGYYGGHTDAYIPYGKDLYYYDVNSLYPFVMKEFPMPGGQARWIDNIEEKHLDTMLGFVLTHVECPTNIKRPFLPYHDEDGTLIFPTGEFSGVYYIEELKYARTYKITMLYGYFFERKESPFKEIISVLYEKRLQAKKEGNIVVSYVYKILMNSLYGRFGINPLSSKTHIGDSNDLKRIMIMDTFVVADVLGEDSFVMSYKENVGISSLDHWNPPRNSAVQLSAAITASARIHMYPYISRDDCYYTDTDSVVFGNPLNEEDLSPTELGKFKEEAKIKEAVFLVPKQYYFEDANEVKNTLKHKGPAKKYVTKEIFKEIYKEPFKKIPVEVTNLFESNKIEFLVKRTVRPVNVGVTFYRKRIPLFNDKGYGLVVYLGRSMRIY